MKLQRDVSLQAHNTLAVPATARWFSSVSSTAELIESIHYSQHESLQRLILGGGSNIVLGGDFDGLVIHLNLRGIELLGEEGESVRVRVAAGENWDDFVRYSLSRGWYGLENLSAIPGSVGAARSRISVLTGLSLVRCSNLSRVTISIVPAFVR